MGNEWQCDWSGGENMGNADGTCWHWGCVFNPQCCWCREDSDTNTAIETSVGERINKKAITNNEKIIQPVETKVGDGWHAVKMNEWQCDWAGGENMGNADGTCWNSEWYKCWHWGCVFNP